MKITRYVISTILILAGIALFGLFIIGIYYKYTIVSQALTLPDGTDAKVKKIHNDVDRSIEYELLEPTLINTPAGKLKVERVRFSENGKIHNCSLSESQVIDTPMGKSKVKKRVFFHESCKIEGCEFSEPQTIETPAGKLKVEKVSFYESGKIGGCEFSEPQTIETPAGKLKVESVSFHESGKIGGCWPCGRWGGCTAAEPQVIDTPAGKLKVEGVKDIAFYESGKIRDCSLSESQVIDTPAGKLKVFGVYFSDSGKVCNLYLAEGKTINGKTYRKGTRIGWDPDMKFLGEMMYNNFTREWNPRHVAGVGVPSSQPPETAPDGKDKTAPK